MNETSEILEPGYFGKLPAYGDFIQKRLPRDFVSPWDDWLQGGIAAAKDRLGENWLNHYLNCPALNFVMAPSMCGEQACAGVTIPSVDKVGRYFNFTLALMLPAHIRPVDFASAQADWFAALEELAISALGQELSQDEIENQLAELTLSIEPEPAMQFEHGEGQLHLAGAGAVTALSGMLPALLDHLLTRDMAAHGLWWHSGSSQVSAQLLAIGGMPGPEHFLQFLMDDDVEPPPPRGEAENGDIDYLDALLSD